VPACRFMASAHGRIRRLPLSGRCLSQVSVTRSTDRQQKRSRELENKRRRSHRSASAARLSVVTPRRKVLLFDETTEEVDFAGRDPVDAETRRPYGRSPGLRAATETNLLPRNGPRDPVPDFFSGLRRTGHFGRPALAPARPARFRAAQRDAVVEERHSRRRSQERSSARSSAEACRPPFRAAHRRVDDGRSKRSAARPSRVRRRRRSSSSGVRRYSRAHCGPCPRGRLRARTGQWSAESSTCNGEATPGRCALSGPCVTR
jgi:hypothetical protein